jgi:hypothetical protein
MIEDKKLGAKIAENPEEAFWIGIKDKCLKDIESNKHEIIINEAIIELADKKIKTNKVKK